MALAYLFDPNMQFQDRNGVNNVAGFLRVYYEGTDDRATTYKNFIGTLNPADIPIDNDGRAVVIVEDEKTYRLEVYTRNGNLQWTQHPLCPLVGGGGSFEQVQSNWDEDDPTSAAFIKNKPELSAIATSGSYDDLSNKPSIPDDSSLVHKSGAETITGIKTFNNAVSPRQNGTSFSKQSKVFVCSIIKPYAEWSAEEQDNDHFRLWTIDITSIVRVDSTYCNIVVKLMGSFYSTSGNGALQKEITFQVYNGNVVISKGDYTVAQSPCADEFAISGVIKSGNDYLVQVVNRNPTANNYPLRLEIDMFNIYNSAVLDDVTMTESITEGLPVWAVDVAQVTANGSPVLTEATAATVAKTGSYNDLSDRPILIAEYGSTTYAQVSQFAHYVGKTVVCAKQLLTAVLIAEDGYSYTFATPPNANGQYHVFTLNNDNSWTDRIIERTHDLICQLKPIVYLGSASMRHILCDRQKYTIENGATVFQPVDVFDLATWINRGDVIQIDGATASDPWGDRYPMWITEMQCSLDSGTNKLYCTNIAVRGYAYSATEISRWGDIIVDEATNTKYLEFQNWT